MDPLHVRLDALEHPMHSLQQQTHTLARRLRWWRGLACGLVGLAVLTWALPSGTAQGTLEQRVTALEATLVKLTFEAATNEVVITGANLHIVNGLGSTDCTDEQNAPIPGCPNGLGNLIVGYNEPRDPVFGESIRTGSHNVVVGSDHNFSRFGGIVVGFRNTISGEFASVSGGTNDTASGDWSLVSGGFNNTASGSIATVSGGNINTASGLQSSVSGGENNVASGIESSISGGKDITVDTEGGWAAGSIGGEVTGSFRSP